MFTANKTWQDKYSQLTDFVSGHDEIRIAPEAVKLPAGARDEFYALFNDVRRTLIRQKLPALLEDALTLNRNITAGEEEVTELLKLKSISYSAIMEWFLHQPEESLMRAAFDLLFDLLKERVDSEQFEQSVCRAIKASFADSFSRGFEKWVALSLVSLLKADRIFQFAEHEVPLSDAHRAGGNVREEVPVPKEANRIVFRYNRETAFVIPSFVINSALLNRYFSLRSDISEPLAFATETSGNRDYYEFSSIKSILPSLMSPGVSFLYLADNPEDISLVADKKRFYRPDVIIECKTSDDWFSRNRLDTVKTHHRTLKPGAGTFIISRGTVPEQAYEELIPANAENEGGSDIRIIETGFDKQKLQPVIDILKQSD